ncbi:YybH family protein [Sphingomicrobium sediminis]|uniref:Nuclear transport factor 2 family protein n=1 Tax=Sphingomicrobium sediminis TaxID=2950949 RepID=A0A9X2J2U0_9SPHN|nr:nuclear transport factor 2 family protein [Sphingomicrobium sediminis]MCM8557380.1 nuclear transport factor 2 family protein [Sphingomicrobium sediminis]
MTIRTIAAAIALASPALVFAGTADHHAEMTEEQKIEQVITDVYAVISGPIGQERDFDAMRAMFTEDARLQMIAPDNSVRGGTVEDYIASSGPFLVQNGFTESALVNRIEVHGDLAQAWSSYSGTFTQNGEPRSLRGINSFQLVRQADGRWLVHSILWQHEGPGRPLPADMEGSAE